MINRRNRNIFFVLCVFLLARQIHAAPAWEQLQQLYAYDATLPIDAKVTPFMGQTHRYQVTFAGLNGRVPGLLSLPTAGKSPYPCVLLLHGYGGSKMHMLPAMLELSNRGVAALALDAPYSGDRAVAGDQIVSTNMVETQKRFIQTVVDWRRGMDYLATRGDIDMSRIALCGVSMGAIMGSLVTAVDTRVKCAALVVGGGDWTKFIAQSRHPGALLLKASIAAMNGEQGAELLETIDPVNFIGHVAPRPLLFLNGRQDNIVPADCATALHDAARDPKTVIWYDQGHMLNLQAFQTAIDWLVKSLGQ